MIHRASRLLLGLALTLGCATPPFDGEKEVSHALLAPPGPRLAPAIEAHPGESGFVTLADGVEALGARIMLADQAEQGIDAQYYFVLSDPTGILFLSTLLEAADRGVRVRLLLDDIATQGYDRAMAALDSHPHFSIRIFNPFSRKRSRVVGGATDFQRVNRRMHNKSFTVDGLATIVGGRNIGAEYFGARDDLEFGDFDLLGFGPVVAEVEHAFDVYWNSDFVIPVTQLVDPIDDPEAELAEFRALSDAELAGESDSPYAQALGATVLEQAQLAPETLAWGPALVVYDDPAKARAGTSADAPEASRLRTPLRAAIEGAQQELTIVSPYFVPLDSGVDFLCGVRERGVRVRILTNSLASTDVAAVHAGYAPYRTALLECGVELYEVRQDVRLTSKRETGVGFSRASLHAKGFIVDRRRLFVGSFNWDPRSAGINTEMGILVESPELSEQVASGIETDIERETYHVVLNADGDLRWRTREDGVEVEYEREPNTTFWRRLGVGILRLLPIREQL